MKEILAIFVIIVGLAWMMLLLLLELYAATRGRTVEEVILEWAAPRLRKRLTRVEAPEQSQEWHEDPPVEDGCNCMGEYPMRVYYKPDWIELVLREIQREDKAKWN